MKPGERFERAVRDAGGTLAARSVYEALAARYREAHRRYHTLGHVAACLARLDRVRASAERPEEIELALFFHDAVYDRTGDDEARSAALAETELIELGVPGQAAARVGALVRATAGHDAGGGDAALLVDIDLSILGARPAAYARYVEALRAEYEHVPDTLFRAGRSAILRAFLARPAIYRTPSFASLESQARQNLSAELARLEGPSGQPA